MAEEELHETDRPEGADDAAAPASPEVRDTKDTAESTQDTQTPTFDVDMDKVEAVLNATADKAALTPQMQRMMARQQENTKRVEETIKGTKSNPRWFVPLFCALMIIGLVWAVVYYLSPGGAWPIPGIGAWNLAIAFAIILVGFIMTMWWR